MGQLEGGHGLFAVHGDITLEMGAQKLTQHPSGNKVILSNQTFHRFSLLTKDSIAAVVAFT